MAKAVEIAPGVYWVGAIDWSERNFHGYTTERGTTYNAYLIVDEKTVLIDTVKAPFAGQMMERIASVVDPASIDFLVANHGEPDHSGSLPAVVAAAPQVEIVTSSPQGAAILKALYGEGLNLRPVKSGDVLSLGRRTLAFTATPMVHWPDNMVTWCPEERILFSNDAFGQHLATSKRFDDEVDVAEALDQAKKYYANIVMCYSAQVRKALEALEGLDIAAIAPAHGVMWRSNVSTILDLYRQWSALDPTNSAVVVFDSMWHTTEAMAEAIAEAFSERGVAVEYCDLKHNHISDIMTLVLQAKYVAVGSPTLNMTMMPTVASFLCYLRGLAPKGRVGLAFGSYGWAPAGPKHVAEALEAAGYRLPLEPWCRQWKEDKAGLAELHDAVLALVDGEDR